MIIAANLLVAAGEGNLLVAAGEGNLLVAAGEGNLLVAAGEGTFGVLVLTGRPALRQMIMGSHLLSRLAGPVARAGPR